MGLCAVAPEACAAGAAESVPGMEGMAAAGGGAMGGSGFLALLLGRGERGAAAKSGGLFDTFGVTPGKGLDLATPSAGDKSYITYAFKDSSGAVVYVGRASGPGSPSKVLAGRLSKGHHVFDSNPGLTSSVIDVQGSYAANRGAEAFFEQGYREQGASLLNADPTLGFSTSARGSKSVGYMDAFFADLFAR